MATVWYYILIVGFHPGESVNCGKATFWAYIVDRHFRMRGVKPVWPRYTLMLKPGHGVAVSNRMLHGGAARCGRAAYRIHIYMTQQGLLTGDIGEPQVSANVYDYRTDPQMFVLARYLDTIWSPTVNMTAA
jgi:hypothetical protein